jgi:hypothetical protein
MDIEVIGEDGSTVKEENLTVADIEAMVYGGSAAQRDRARVKKYYFTHTAGGRHENLRPLRRYRPELPPVQKIGLPGTVGTVTFESEKGRNPGGTLEDIVKSDYFNEVTGPAI